MVWSARARVVEFGERIQVAQSFLRGGRRTIRGQELVEVALVTGGGDHRRGRIHHLGVDVGEVTAQHCAAPLLRVGVSSEDRAGDHEQPPQLRTQIETAQIDFDTAEAAFKYRYSVIEPAQFPKHAAKPNAIMFILAGLVGGLMVAMFSALASDIMGGRFVERWQVERSLDLPVLVDLDVSRLPKHLVE